MPQLLFGDHMENIGNIMRSIPHSKMKWAVSVIFRGVGQSALVNI